jgi:peptidoglycan/xylan/chitin deacetylase (PgdA/CDA1 family)
MRGRLTVFFERLLGPEAQPAGHQGSPLPDNESRLRDYAAKARAQGFERLLLYFTFDCDTDEDAAGALELDPWLRGLGICAAYAVPGIQLTRAASAYRQLAASGAEFLNHGHLPHAEWREDRYVPITFYDQLSTAEVVEDIRRGHETVTDVIGRPPHGFRAPHFGSFQATHQLEVIYRTARELGYSYCSTTVPQTALDHGPVIDRGGLYEIPLFGSYYAPTAILDSWTYLEDRKTFRLGQEYFDLFRDTVDFILANGLPGVLAYYADPAHVVRQKPFLDAIEMITAHRVPSVTADELVTIYQGRRNRDGLAAVAE